MIVYHRILPESLPCEGWQFDELPNVMRQLEPIAKREGYLLAIYGSAIRSGGLNSGRDLDLLLVPWRYSPSVPQEVVRALAASLHGEIKGAAYHGAMGSQAFVIVISAKTRAFQLGEETALPRYVDVQVRPFTMQFLPMHGL